MGSWGFSDREGGCFGMGGGSRHALLSGQCRNIGKPSVGLGMDETFKKTFFQGYSESLGEAQLLSEEGAASLRKDPMWPSNHLSQTPETLGVLASCLRIRP